MFSGWKSNSDLLVKAKRHSRETMRKNYGQFFFPLWEKLDYKWLTSVNSFFFCPETSGGVFCFSRMLDDKKCIMQSVRRRQRRWKDWVGIKMRWKQRKKAGRGWYSLKEKKMLKERSLTWGKTCEWKELCKLKEKNIRRKCL